MKKAIVLILILLITFGAVGCRSNKYPPQKSTKEESRVVMTLSLEGEKYEVKYELYRALFLSNRTSVDGGDRSVWSGESKDTYIAEINEIIKEKAARIYSAFHLAKILGIDPYSKEIDEKISEYIKISVEGNGETTGFGGDYDAYLKSLSDAGLNYSTQELMLRYSILLEKIDEHYKGKYDENLGYVNSKYNLSDEELRSYYFGNDSVRVLHAYMQDGVGGDTVAKMESIREGIVSSESDIDAALYIINHTLVTPTDLIINKKVSGITVGRYAVDESYLAYRSAAFSLGIGETSAVIEVNDGTKGYYVIHTLEKTEDHYVMCNEEIKESFFDNMISKKLVDITEGLKSSATYDNNYNEINHGDISI